MRIAIMQPYLFPYIGYFQLINMVDKFVVFDDVNYINKGWINRNNLLSNGVSNLFTIPLQGASQNKMINEISVLDDAKWKEKLLRSIEQNYKKAPFFNSVYPIIESSLYTKESLISKFNVVQIQAICSYLDIKTEFIYSSTLPKEQMLKGQDRIIDICLKEKATVYVNPIGGMDLYCSKDFVNNHIELYFIKSENVEYKQFKNDFVPFLSIIDVLMFNSKDRIAAILEQYNLISNE